MREELTWAMERRKRLARGFHPGPLFPGGFELYTRSFWPEHCHMTAHAGSLPRALPAWVGGDLAPASAIGTAAAPCLSTSVPLWRFLAEELHGTHAASLHRAPSISPEGPWRGSGGSLHQKPKAVQTAWPGHLSSPLQRPYSCPKVVEIESFAVYPNKLSQCIVWVLSLQEYQIALN